MLYADVPVCWYARSLCVKHKVITGLFHTEDFVIIILSCLWLNNALPLHIQLNSFQENTTNDTRTETPLAVIDMIEGLKTGKAIDFVLPLAFFV